ncbi:MAG: hypothetical protein HC783_10500 [Rhodobacteraceae bacterium]|nr:hypothetical protein [Paracoccaceae bacterium]
MKLYPFVIGMGVAAILAILWTLSVGGSWVAAVLMGVGTIVLAQVLYVVLLVVLARNSGAENPVSKRGLQAWFSRPPKLGDTPLGNGSVNPSSPSEDR